LSLGGRTAPGASHSRRVASTAMRAFRRALLALAATALFAGVARLRGSGGTPPQRGGWRELSGPDMR